MNTLSRPLKDSFSPKGRVEVFVTAGGKPTISKDGDIGCYGECKLLDYIDVHNIIVNIGKDSLISGLTSGTFLPIIRMAIGDRGTLPADPQVPKVATDTMTALFNEVYRDDIDTYVLNVGTPTVHEVKFIKTFSSLLIPITAFSNQAAPVINEVGLITGDINGSGNPLPRPPVSFPNVPDADEKLFSIRTFKSVPFEAANEIAITIRYTIYIE